MREKPRTVPCRALAAIAVAALALPLDGCLLRAKRGEAPLVGAVDVEGNHALGDGDITGKLALTESGRRIVFRFGDENPFEAEAVRGDAKRIERVYAAHGYFSAKVVDVRTREDRGRTNVTFVVEEGPASKVRARTIHGLGKLPKDVLADVLLELPLAPGLVFSEDAYDGTKAALHDRLRARGYAEAEVEGRVTVDRDKAAVDVELTATPGLRYRVSRVHAYGTQNVSRSRVIEASLVNAGDTYTPELLADAQRRIYALGVFGVVQVDPGPYNRKDATVPLVITVTEAPFQTYEAGAGFEIDPTRDVGRGRLLYTHRNLWRGLQKLQLGGTLGYAFLPGVVSFLAQDGTTDDHGLVGNLKAELSQPRMLRSPFDGFVALDAEKDLTSAFRFFRLGGRLGTVFRPDRIPQLSSALSLNYDYYFGVREDDGTTTSDSLTSSGCGQVRKGELAPDTCKVLFLEWRVGLDFRDNQISPHKGFFASLNTQWAAPFLADFHYLRVSPEVRGYIPIGRPLTLALRGRYGWLQKLGGTRDPPGVKRFSAGGATSVRTAGADQLGPRDFRVIANDRYPKRSPNPYVADAPVPLYGTRLLEGSTELRWKTGISDLALGLFFDVGGLTDEQDGFLPTAWQYGPGIGLRYHTAFGPVRLDLAYRMGRPQAPNGVRAPDGVTVADPLIAPSCEGKPAPTCYEDHALEFFFTLGEAF